MAGRATTAADRGATEGELLAAWDAARSGPVPLRPFTLAEVLTGRQPREVPAGAPDGEVPAGRRAGEIALIQQPLGEVNRQLLDLVRQQYADRLDGVLPCPACGERLEVEIPVTALLAQGAAPAAGGPGAEVAGTGVAPTPPAVTVSGDGWRVAARPATPADLAAAAREPDREAARAVLLGRVVLAADPHDALTDPDVADALDAALEQCDPLGSLAVGLACPACGDQSTAAIDVGAWVWALAEAQVQRLVFDVHRLARAYGWSEQEALAVGPHRRALYLELVP